MDRMFRIEEIIPSILLILSEEKVRPILVLGAART